MGRKIQLIVLLKAEKASAESRGCAVGVQCSALVLAGYGLFYPSVLLGYMFGVVLISTWFITFKVYGRVPKMIKIYVHYKKVYIKMHKVFAFLLHQTEG